MSLPWISMDFNGSSMDFCRISHRLPMDFHGFPWISVDLHGFPADFPWISDGFPMDVHGLPNGCPWLFHGCPWISLGSPMEFHRFQLDSHGFRYISMDLHRSPSFPIAFCRFLRISIDIHGFLTDLPQIPRSFPVDFHGCPLDLRGSPWSFRGFPMDFLPMYVHGYRLYLH